MLGCTCLRSVVEELRAYVASYGRQKREHALIAFPLAVSFYDASGFFEPVSGLFHRTTMRQEAWRINLKTLPGSLAEWQPLP